MNRRTFIASTSSAIVLSAIDPILSFSRSRRMGVTLASYAKRWRSDTPSQKYPGFQHALDVLEHCHSIGAGGVQVGVGNWSSDFAGQVRDRREELGMYLEGQIRLPEDRADVERFEVDVQNAKEAGATILRTVCLRGRRYETFETMEEFKAFRKASYNSLELAEKVVRKHRVKLAVENHKDWRIPEMMALLDHLSSEWVGVTLDTGNNISLLEDPMVTAEALAPYTFTTHFKDMSVEEYEDGFLLAEVPLGQGFLDLPRIVEVCRQHNPEVTFNLEMITRDPLHIPCLTDSYWATFGDSISASEFASMLHTVRQHEHAEPLPLVSERDLEAQLALEESNVLSSFVYARNKLGMV